MPQTLPNPDSTVPPGWRQRSSPRAFTRTFDFPEWREAAIFVELALQQAERHGQEPRLVVSRRRVTVELTAAGAPDPVAASYLRSLSDD